MVLVDTPVWSLALRRRAANLSSADRNITQALYELVQRHQARLLGSTRQEVLSGIREESQFRRIRDHLRDFPDVDLESGDHEEAARISNQCRGAGVASSGVDMLLCAVSIRHHWQIFTTDGDFAHYRKIADIELFLPTNRLLRN